MLARSLMLAATCVLSVGAFAMGDEGDAKLIELAGGKLVLEVPKEWKKEKPKSQIVQYEFSAPVAKDAEEDKAEKPDPTKQARITIMGSGGGVEANLERWYGQFEQPNGGDTADVAKVEEMEVSGQKVHYVDITGSFKDTMGAGPFSGAKPVLREDYRMLGAIIETKELGDYYVKITGPAAVLEELNDSFKEMLKGLKAK